MSRPCALLLALLAVPLAACGFTPMYATGGLSQGLSGIEVVAADGRAGFLVAEDLNDALATQNAAQKPYRLTMALTRSRVDRGQRNNAPDRYELTLTADYQLTDKASGKVVFSGTEASEVTADTADQPYASLASESDAETRAANDLARRIQLDLARWMRDGTPAPEPIIPPVAPTPE